MVRFAELANRPQASPGSCEMRSAPRIGFWLPDAIADPRRTISGVSVLVRRTGVAPPVQLPELSPPNPASCRRSCRGECPQAPQLARDPQAAFPRWVSVSSRCAKLRLMSGVDGDIDVRRPQGLLHYVPFVRGRWCRICAQSLPLASGRLFYYACFRWLRRSTMYRRNRVEILPVAAILPLTRW
ncbi:hypothetical protein KCP69_04665 [Salmonella enterica subsp. enterica]|nr:hypothetical protein KCP69_04665 [Salmonella enterica subsp. enterica]